ncbi:MAG: CehA/McbA family metallohydrolase [Prolixibacteraceae bacterium]|nr:CehA/McbA family metallohydrolase [Prolixibacteraceae bacterium]
MTMSRLLFKNILTILFLIIFFQGFACCETDDQPDDPAEAEKKPSIKKLNYYFGDLHQHTTLSDGDLDIEEAIKYIKEKKVLDFVAISDHSQYFDFPDEWGKSQNWKKVQETTAKYNEDGVFIALPSFEWSKNSETGTGGKGHINVYNTSWWATANQEVMSLENFYQKLVGSPGALAMFNHPSKTNFKNFGFYNTSIDERMVLFEIATRSGRPTFVPRFENYVYALDKGWRLAPADNTDTHKGFWWAENCFGRTAVIATELSREAIYEALRNRQAYATYDKNLKINFAANGEIMGAILKKPKKLNILIEIEDPDSQDKINRIDIITEGGLVAHSKEFSSNIVKWELEADPAKRYYFLRIVQADNDLAFSSPIWTGQ